MQQIFDTVISCFGQEEGEQLLQQICNTGMKKLATMQAGREAYSCIQIERDSTAKSCLPLSLHLPAIGSNSSKRDAKKYTKQSSQWIEEEHWGCTCDGTAENCGRSC